MNTVKFESIELLPETAYFTCRTGVKVKCNATCSVLEGRKSGITRNGKEWHTFVPNDVPFILETLEDNGYTHKLCVPAGTRVAVVAELHKSENVIGEISFWGLDPQTGETTQIRHFESVYTEAEYADVVFSLTQKMAKAYEKWSSPGRCFLDLEVEKKVEGSIFFNVPRHAHWRRQQIRRKLGLRK